MLGILCVTLCLSTRWCWVPNNCNSVSVHQVVLGILMPPGILCVTLCVSTRWCWVPNNCNSVSVHQVVLGILMPPSILWLEFKTKEELQLMPQTVEEHIQDIEDQESDSSSSSASIDESLDEDHLDVSNESSRPLGS